MRALDLLSKLQDIVKITGDAEVEMFGRRGDFLLLYDVERNIYVIDERLKSNKCKKQ